MFHIMFVHNSLSSVWGCRVATFLEIAARSVSNLFSLFYIYFPFWLKSGICHLIFPQFLFIAFLLLLLNVFGVGVSCRNLYSFVVYLYVNGSG